MKHYHGPPALSFLAADALPADQVRLAALADLARFTGSSRQHTESDLRCYLRWCADRGLDPLAARRADLEQYIRWMQETCRFRPSTISRRFSVAAGFYRTCVIDAVLEHSPAGTVRRPNVPAESPTLGFTHRRGTRMDRHAATRRLRHLAQHAGVRITRPHPRMLRHTFVTTSFDAGVDLRDVPIAARHADPRTTTRYAERAGPPEPRPAPPLHPRRLHGLRHLTPPRLP